MAAESEEFERAWAQIVADLTSEANAEPTRSAGGEDSVEERPSSPDDLAADVTAETEPSEPTVPRGRNAAQSEPGKPGGQSAAGEEPSNPGGQSAPQSEPIVPGWQSAAESELHRPPDPGAFVDTWSDEGHFTAPPPPDLPAGSPVTRLGWAGTLGGIVTLVIVTLTGWDVPRVVIWAAGLATLAGFVTLVWQLPDSREDGWDDGAQV